MTADEMRAALTAVLAEVPELDAEFVTDRILPTVRGIAAATVQAEADELREVALLAKEGQQWNPHRVWTWLSDRADVLAES